MRATFIFSGIIMLMTFLSFVAFDSFGISLIVDILIYVISFIGLVLIILGIFAHKETAQ